MAIRGHTLKLAQELDAQLQAIEDQQVRDLTDAWVRAWDEIAPDLAATFIDMLSGNEEVTRTQLLRSVRLRNSLTVIADALEDLSAQAGITITDRLRGVIDDAGKAQATIIASQLPPATPLIKDLERWSRVDARQIDAIVKRSTEQITSSLKPLSAKAYDAVQRELVRGVASGSNPKETARRIVDRAEGEFNGGLSRAITLARTETLDAHRAAAAAAQEQNADVLSGWIWAADLDVRTCPACWGMNGTEHDLSEPGPQGHQNCRCARIPVVKPWSELGITSVVEPPPAFPDADAAFAQLSPFQQQRVLGPARYAAWVRGEYPRSQWATKQTNPGWRPSFVSSKPPAQSSRPPSRRVSPRPRLRSRSRTRAHIAPPPPPPPPSVSSTAVPDLPDMGRAVGDQRQQTYAKQSTLAAGTAPSGPFTRASAHSWYTYVPDPDDRTTALLQYMKEFEEVIKERAAAIERGEPLSRAQRSRIRRYLGLMRNDPETGILRRNGSTPANYTLDDILADVEGAALRMLAWKSQDKQVGTVFKAINLPGNFDLSDQAGIDAAFAAVRLDGWFFTSATGDRSLARGYLDPRYTQVLLIIEGATGIELDSMGRMAGAPEVLLSGGLENPTYDVINGILRIRGRWKR